jgi:hypothetical protein
LLVLADTIVMDETLHVSVACNENVGTGYDLPAPVQLSEGGLSVREDRAGGAGPHR